ncbi:helix-turn-helix domain-containing protein [Paenibacillus tarimensis]
MVGKMFVPDTRLTPIMLTHVFWKRKAVFQLPEDQYDEWVLFAVTEGCFRYEIGGEKGEASFGDLVICPPLTLFAREVAEPLSFHFYRYKWHNAADETVVYPQGGKLSIRDLNRLSSNYRYLDRSFPMLADKSRLKLADHILRDLWQLLCLESGQASSIRSETAADGEMLEAAGMIRKSAYERLAMKEISSNMGMSPVQFTRRFQAAHGQTPIDYLTEIRLHRARELLLETDLTLDHIAERCGYDNGFYLSRIFSKKMNISPSVYRRSHRI